MKNSTYYQNKILYALSKIDYAKQRMGDKHDKVLSKIYSALLTYGKDAPLKNIVELTGLPKEVVVEKLKELKALGIIEWEGVQLRDEREVSLKKVDFQSWYIDLMHKMKDGSSEPVKEAMRAVIDEEEWVEIHLAPDLLIKVTKERLKKALL